MKNDPARARTSTRAVSAPFVLLCALLLVAVTGSFGMGRFPIGPGALVDALRAKLLGSGGVDPVVQHVIFEIRLPRLVAALAIGLALSAAGAVYQGMFKNPLVSPDLLGASAGAGFGASLAITLGLGSTGIQSFAFVCGMAAVLLAWSIGQALRRDQVLGLVLSGVVIGALFSAGTSLLKYLADPDDTLPAITFWLMGGLNGVTPDQAWFLLAPVGVSLAVVWLLRSRLNVLTFGDEEAQALGVPVKALRVVVVVSATLLTTASVCVGGLIGWVGLVVPHLARMIVGPDFRVLLPVTTVLGALYLLVVDDIARLLLEVEIPLGILTSLVGAPFLAVLILMNREW